MMAKHKNLGRRTLSLLMALVMSFSLLQVSAFASSDLTAEQEANKAAQVVAQGDENVAVREEKVWTTKTVAATEEEGKFEITLQVKTKDVIQQVTSAEDATVDVVLLIDASNSMTSSGVDRLSDAKSAANSFAGTFLADNEAGKRRVSVISYGSEVLENFDMTTSAATVASNVGAIVVGGTKTGKGPTDYYYGTEDKGGTNIQAGLRAAETKLASSTAAYKIILLLTDGEPTYCYQGTGTGTTATSIISVGRGQNQYNQTVLHTTFEASRSGNGKSNDNTVNASTRAYSTVSEARRIQASGIEIYGVGMDISNNNMALYTMYNSVSHTTDPNGNPSYAGYYFDYDSSTGGDLGTSLAGYFQLIATNILVKTHAWWLHDEMGQYVDFAGFVEGAQNGASVNANGTIDWNLKAPTVATTRDGDLYVYTTKYYVTLDKATYPANTPIDTNSIATLTYAFDDEVYEADEGTHKKGEMILYTHNIATPKVQGYRGAFSFLKKDASGDLLTGAQFQLFAADGFTKENPGTALYTAYSTGGNVNFSGIAFGEYKMMETAVSSDIYDLDKAQETVYDVTVAYGVTTVKNGTKTVDANTVFTNYRSQVPVDITVSKTWVDGNNADKSRPAEITFTLVQTIGSKAKDYGTYTLTAADGWTTTIEDLPSINLEDNQAITYSVKEETVEGYTTTYGADGESLTIKNTISTINDKVDITLTKTWVGPKPADNAAGTVEVKLYRTSAKADSTRELVGTYSVSGTETVSGLAKYDAEGYLYTYTAAETAVAGYAAFSKSEGNAFSFTNVVNQDTKTISGTKLWNIAGWTGAAPVAVFELTASNYSGFAAQTDEVAYVAGENGEYRFEGLAVYVYTLSDGTQTTDISALEEGVTVTAAEEIQYVVTEKSTGGDQIVSSRNGSTFTNTLQDQIDIKVTKVWDDSDNEFGTRPDSVTLILTGSNSKENVHEVTFKAAPVYETAEDSETEPAIVGYDWTDVALTKTFTVDKYDASGALITYTVSEAGVKNGTIAGKDGTEYAVSYDQAAYTVTNTLGGGELTISGTKIWVDGNNEQGLRPAAIQVGLFKAGTAEAVQTVDVAADGDGNWAYTFEAVDLYENGKKVVYTVKELTELSSYSTTYSGDNNRNIKNTLKNETFSITGVKSWVDGENKNDLRPASVTLTLIGTDGTSKKGVANAENGWKYEFTGLNKYDANGKIITYTVDEEALPGSDYEKTSTGSKKNDYTVTNTLKQGKVSVSVSKSWVSDEDCTEKQVTVQLYRNGEAFGEPKTITGSSSTTFENLDKYDESYAPYTYTVKEAAGVPSGYASSVKSSGANSFAITNTKRIESTTIGVEKTFVGPEAEGSIYAGLFRKSGESYTKVDTVELNAENSWKASFAAQPATDSSYNRYEYVIRELTSADDEVGLLAGEKNGSYTVSYSGSSNRVITNTIDQADKSLTVEKRWENMNASGVNVNPASKPVKVQLGYMAAGQFVAYGEPVELNEENAWTHTYPSLPTYALASAGLTLTDGSELVYDIREVAADGSLVAEAGSINLGTDNKFTVNYTTEDGKLVVSNTFDSPEKYYYRVDRHYSATINGKTTTEDVVGTLVTVQPDGDREISIGADNTFDVDASAYVKYGKYTYTFEYADPAEVQVLELPNHEYVIHLYYSYTYTSGGGGGGSDDTFLNVKKVWKGDDAETRPESIQVQLLRDGEAYGEPKTLSADNNWKTTWNGLDRDYDWSVEEVEVPEGYTDSVSGKGTSWTITNTLGEVEIPEEPIPGGDDPDPTDPGLDIPDEDVPTADVPKTGDNMALWLMAAAVSGLGLAWMVISGKKREEKA